LAKFVAFALENETDEKEKAMMQSLLDGLKAGGKDRVVMTSDYIENGTSSRLEIEEGIIKAIGKLVMQLAAGGR
jgi:hypothetical protein